jgi:hypothetical protein
MADLERLWTVIELAAFLGYSKATVADGQYRPGPPAAARADASTTLESGDGAAVVHWATSAGWPKARQASERAAMTDPLPRS